MAGDWIKIEHTLPDKPEVMELADILEMPENEVVGLLVRFWSWVDANMSPECPLVYGTAKRIGRLVSCDKFVDAMVAVGWLEANGDRIAIPNYEHHLSQSAKRRGVEAKKKRTQRKKTSRAAGDKNGTREEKRREESVTTNVVTQRRAMFVRPTLDEVAAYCWQRKNQIDPLQFIDHYESNGWKVGKNPMKDWKAAVRTWEKNDLRKGNQNAQPRAQAHDPNRPIGDL